jgi:hypothetical protein
VTAYPVLPGIGVMPGGYLPRHALFVGCQTLGRFSDASEARAHRGSCRAPCDQTLWRSRRLERGAGSG